MAKPHKLADGRYECQNCLRKFPKPDKTYIEPKFCCDECRKEFHFAGGLSLKKLETRVRQWVNDELKTIAEKLRAEMLAMIPPRRNGAVVEVNHGIPVPNGGRVSPNKKARR